MIATRAQKKKEPPEKPESEAKRVSVENLENPDVKQTEKQKSKTNLDRNVEEPIELDESRNDLPFRNVPELEVVLPEKLEKEHCETSSELEKHVPVYKTHALVEDLELDDLLDHILKADVTVKLGTLLKSVKGTRETLRKLLTSKRVPIEPKMVAKIESMNDNALKYWETYAQTNDLIDVLDVRDLTVSSFTVLCERTRDLPKGSIVASDPILQYLNTLPTNESPKPIFVAAEAFGLRTVFPLINNKACEESILDGGSQIVSMSKAAAEDLGLTWDPKILIHMQSANGQFEKSLGLAKNVPFKFGTVTVYLQVHVLNEPAYKVLLGRPFDAVTRSTYKNDEKGGQTLILKCPATNVDTEIDTFERGKSPEGSKTHNQDFRNSMIWWKAGEN